MSGSGLARRSRRDASRASPGACVAGAHLAILGGHGAYVDAGLVAGIVPWRPVDHFLAKPLHGCAVNIYGLVGRVMGSPVRRSARR